MTLALQNNSIVHIGFMPDAEEINRQIMAAYAPLREEDIVKRSHHFGGRYENLYIERDRIPAIQLVLAQAEEYAKTILQAQQPIRSGFWFNDMGPGQSTSEHDHDEYDELLSGVYYVQVPEKSGNLMILDQYSRTEVNSQAGMFVFFAPTVLHSVSANNSSQRRISLGMNFGPAAS